jgi:hypothetical protein
MASVRLANFIRYNCTFAHHVVGQLVNKDKYEPWLSNLTARLTTEGILVVPSFLYLGPFLKKSWVLNRSRTKSIQKQASTQVIDPLNRHGPSDMSRIDVFDRHIPVRLVYTSFAARRTPVGNPRREF